MVMEVSGTVLRQVTCISGSGTHGHDYCVVAPRVLARSRVRLVRGCGFRDEGHVQYYQDTKNREPVLSNKKKLKLLKDLSKAKVISSFPPPLGFAFNPDQRALLDNLNINLTTQDGGEVLLREIEKVKAEEKELKKKRKQEKKAKLKALKMKNTPDCESSSSSSSESSDSDCDKVVDMNTFRGAGVGVSTKQVDELELKLKLKLKLQPSCLQSTLLSTPPLLPDTTTPQQHVSNNVVNNPSAAAQKTIEVCMGNKCKKSGSVALMQEFEKVVGVEGAVVGCKCMGKCKTAPNVRIQNPVLDHGVSGGKIDDDSLKKIPSNPLCIGVGLEDVDTIVARFLGENNQDMMMGVTGATI